MNLKPGKKIYFASDNHLGAPDATSSVVREKIFVQWLSEIIKDAQALFLMGDLFDVWIEYKKVVPKGFVRVLGKLAELSDAGVELHYFVGNHDMWMRDYFEKELNAKIYFEKQHLEINGKQFLLAHGDGLGPGDLGYKRMKKLFRNPVAQWFLRWLHPDLGVKLAQYLSLKNKLISGDDDLKYEGPEKEWLYQYALVKLKEQHYDYFVFGHRHLPLEIELNERSKYFNLGDWISYYTYGVFDGSDFQLNHWKSNND